MLQKVKGDLLSLTDIPSLLGVTPLVEQLGSTSVIVTWTQDTSIPENQAQFYGYNLLYDDGAGDFKQGSRIQHNASSTNQSITFASIEPYIEYTFKIVPCRMMDDVLECGPASYNVSIQLTTTTSTQKPTSTTSSITLQTSNKGKLYNL